jgi:phage gpG-like protein
MEINVKIAGVETLAGLPARVRAACGLSMMMGIDRVMRGQVIRTFEKQRAPESGAPWKKTSPFTLGMRRGSSDRTLYATGNLQDSITARTPLVTADSVTLGTNERYAEVQFGRTGGGNFTITPKGKYLAIPANAKAAKLASGRQHWVKALFASDPRMKWLFGKGRKVWGIGIPVKGGAPQVWAYLKTSVTLPARPYLGIGPEQGAEIEAFAASWIDSAIAGNGGTQ